MFGMKGTGPADVVGLLLGFRAFCDLCGRPFRVHRRGLVGRHICGECLEQLIFISPPICGICGKPLPRRHPETSPGRDICSDCQQFTRFFRLARSVGVYDGLFKSALLSLKYRGRREVARPFGALLAERILRDKEMLSADVIIPVPLHPERLALRGYNQATLLAQEASRWTGIPLSSDILERALATPAQSGLLSAKRRTNLIKAFTVRTPRRVAGRRVLLIDDILTTGATANECARTLLRAGAAEVLVLTVVSGIIEKEFAPHPATKPQGRDWPGAYGEMEGR